MSTYSTIGPYKVLHTITDYLPWGSLERVSHLDEEKQYLIRTYHPVLSKSQRFQSMVAHHEKALLSISHPNIPKVHKVCKCLPVLEDSTEHDEERHIACLVMDDLDILPLRPECPPSPTLPKTETAFTHFAQGMANLCDAIECTQHYTDPQTGTKIGYLPGNLSPQSITYHNDTFYLLDIFHPFPETGPGALHPQAPEVLLGENWKSKTDVYVLGGYLYYLLTHSAELLMSIQTTDLLLRFLESTFEPTPLSSLNPSIPEALESCIHQAVERDESTRIPSPLDFAESLRTLYPDPNNPIIRDLKYDQALQWLRDRICAEDLFHIAQFFEQQPQAASTKAITDSVWGHFGGELIKPLEEDRYLPKNHERLLGALPESIDSLESIAIKSTHPETLHTIIRILHRLQRPACIAPLYKLTESDFPDVQARARKLLKNWSRSQFAKLKDISIEFVPCSFKWDDLTPTDQDQVKYCGRCDELVKRVDNLESLRDVAGRSCVFYTPTPSTSTQAIEFNRDNRHWELLPGYQTTLGSHQSDEFWGHPSLKEDHALMFVLPNRQIRLIAQNGPLSIEGVPVTEAQLDPSKETSVELGELLLKTHAGRVYMFAGAKESMIDKVGRPNPYFGLRAWEEAFEREESIRSTAPPSEKTVTGSSSRWSRIWENLIKV